MPTMRAVSIETVGGGHKEIESIQLSTHSIRSYLFYFDVNTSVRNNYLLSSFNRFIKSSYDSVYKSNLARSW